MNKINLKEFARIELSPLPTLLRFLVLHVLSACTTLLVCPQFGIGPIGGGHGLSSWVMHYGSFACGAFCGALFYGVGTLISLTVMQWEEVLWLKRNQSFVFTGVFVLVFSCLMIAKLSLGVGSVHESFSYYTAWIIVGFLSMFLMTKVTTQWRLNK